MWTHPFRRLSALAICIGLAACSADDDTTKPAAESKNDDKPNGNASIVAEAKVGSLNSWSSIWELEPAAAGAYVFTGRNDGYGGIGEMSAGGTVRWHSRVSHSVGSFQVLGASAPVPGGVVLAGKQDTDGDGQSEVGYLSLYSAAGRLLDVETLTDSMDVWVNSLRPVTDSSFIVAGGTRRGGVSHPYVVLLAVRAPGSLEIGAKYELADVGYLVDMVMLPAPDTERAFAATSWNGTTWLVRGLRAPWPEFAPVTVEWSREVTSTTGGGVGLDDIEQEGGNVYVVGEVDDDRKPAMTGGGLWSSGLALSYTGAGDLRWRKVVQASQHSDHYYALVAAPDAIHVVGIAAGYSILGSPKQFFGYGWITTFDPATGESLANLTLGSDAYESGFYAVQRDNASLVCAGWTEYDTEGGPYRGWLSTVNPGAVQSAGVAPFAGAPALPGQRGATHPERGRRGWPENLEP